MSDNEQRKNLRGEVLGPFGAFLLQGFRIARDVGGVERALSEYAAKAVGEPLRDDEGVGNLARAEDVGLDHLAQKTGDPREKGEATDGNEIANHGSTIDRGGLCERLF